MLSWTRRTTRQQQTWQRSGRRRQSTWLLLRHEPTSKDVTQAQLSQHSQLGSMCMHACGVAFHLLNGSGRHGTESRAPAASWSDLYNCLLCWQAASAYCDHCNTTAVSLHTHLCLMVAGVELQGD